MITSPQNPRVKLAAKLRDARARRVQGRIIIDGARELLRAIDAGVEFVELFVCDDLCQSEDCRRVLDQLADGSRAGKSQVEKFHVSAAVFEKLAYGNRTDGVVGIANMPSRRIFDLKLPSNPLVAVLDGVEKPGNIGAVLRSADGAKVSGLVVADAGTDLYNPNAIRASLGAIFTLPICTASADETLDWLNQHRLNIYTARLDAARNYSDADFTRPCAIVLGSEAAGLSHPWTQPSKPGGSDIVPIRVPMLGRIDSLNVSAAAAILFYEALRQRDAAASNTPR